MDTVNVFVMNDTYTYGLLVPFGYNYMGFVDTTADELKIDRRRLGIKIEHQHDWGSYNPQIAETSDEFSIVEARMGKVIITLQMSKNTTRVTCN